MRLLLLFMVFSMSFVVYGQEKDVEMLVTIMDDDEGRKLSGATVSIYADGALVGSYTSGGNGKVPTIYVPTGKYYQIFIRKSGYVTKMAELDARIDIIEDAPDPLYLKFETALFRSIESVDFSFLEKTPMTKFDFDSEYYYRYDKEYTEQMLKKIEELKKKIAEKREEEEKKDKEAKKTEADFLAYVEAGDKAMKNQSYETAVEQYGLALNLRKDDLPVQEKLKEAQRLLDEQKKNAENDKLYAAKMAEASKAYKDEKLEEAINLYTEASALKRNEKEPEEKIAEIRAKLAAQKALNEKIAALVSAGDMALAAEGFDEAIDKYTEALGLKDDPDVKQKLEDAKKQKQAVEEAAAAEKLKIEQYNALMKTGEDLLVKEELENAKAKFTEAKNLMPDEVLPQKKIEEIDALLKEQKALEEKLLAYRTKMKEAADAEAKKDWEPAIALYKEALDIQPLEQEPKLKIKELTDIIAKENALKEEYNKFIAEGDQFASTEEYENAISKYEAARQIDETDEVTKKIKDALDAMQALAEARNKALRLEAEYKALIEKAEKERDADRLEDALASFTEAQKLKEDEPYPAEEIDKINKILAERKLVEEAKAKEDAAYQAIIDAGNTAFDAENWEESKSKFTEANVLRKDDPLPIAKLKDIETKLAELAAIAAKDKAYNEAMKAGQEAFNSKEYEKAISEYTKAKSIKEEEVEPQAKIEEINKILTDMKDAAEKEAAYEAAMIAGQDLFTKKSYKEAISAFEKALSFKPEDEKAKKEIEKINEILKEQADQAALEAEFAALVLEGDQLFEDKKYEEAKVKYLAAQKIIDSEDVMQKIKNCDAQIKLLDALAAKKAEFDQLLAEADHLFGEESWKDAIVIYEAAKQIESTDYIDQRIKEANDKLLLLVKDKELEAKVNDMITEAKSFEAAENYQMALDTYKEAYKLRQIPEIEESIKKVEQNIAQIEAIKSSNKEYAEKLAEADAAMKNNKFESAIDLYKAALVIKEKETYPKQQIEACEAAIAKLNEEENTEKFNAVIAKADQLFFDQKYDEAIKEYETAKLIMPSNTYPDKKITEIRDIRDKLANAEAEKIKKENEYKDLVNKADNKFNTQNFEDAIGLYKDAQKIKAFDPYVEGKIKDAEAKLKTINEAKALAQKYQSFIDKADALMAKEEWTAAIQEYNTAQLYDKSNPYPKSQIELAEKALENDSKVLSESAYQALLKDAQSKMDAKDYEVSLTLYKSAFRQRPTDNVPADKIRELNSLIANSNAVASAESKYKTLIDKADNLFEKKDWKKARVYYVEAYNLTNNSYPDDQIKKIDAINNKFSSDQYSKMISKADEYFDDENYEKAKGLYTRAIKTFTSQNSAYPKAQIKKINAILNPPALLAGGDTKPVGEKVNLSEAEIQRMFQEAEAASKNKDVTKVQNAGQSANNAAIGWQQAEVDATYQAVDTIELQKDFVAEQIANAEMTRQENEVSTHLINQNIIEKQKYEQEYGQNVSYRQMQVVENVSKTTQSETSKMDRGRQDFVPISQDLSEQFRDEQRIQNADQNRVLFTQVDQIETVKAEQENAFTNADIARKNAELDVENARTNIVNSANQNAWNSEDLSFATQAAKEKMDAEQFESQVYSDVPRQKMEEIIKSTDADYIASDRKSKEINADIYNNTSEAVKALQDNLVESQKEADAGRLKMEIIDTEIENSYTKSMQAQAQMNQTQVELTNESITDLKDDQFKTHQNKTNKLYEDRETIDENFSEVINSQVQSAAISENNMHIATNKIDAAQTNMDDNASKANKATENSADEILINQDLILKQQKETKDNNEKVVHQTEDVIMSLRDINVNEITQAVKNELGTKYPEGVTEEVYQQKDQDGYLVSYVIRRVVVKDGEGNVYEKTQMKHGVSYTKNGQAISEYTWQDQTEDATLIYH